MTSIKTFEIHLDLSNCPVMYDYIREERIEKPEKGEWDLPSVVNRARRSPDEVQRSKEMLRSHKRFAQAHTDKAYLEKEQKQDSTEADSHRAIFSDFFSTDLASMVLPPWVLPVFNVGDTVRGHVVMDVTELTAAENVKIEFMGRANTLIAVHTDKVHSYNYEDDIYVDNCILLWQKEGSKEDIESAISPNIQVGKEIPIGRRKVNFEFEIPAGAQDSVPELMHGGCWLENFAHISYFLKATVNKGNMLSRGNIVVHQPVWVESTRDISADLFHSPPVHVAETKKVGFFDKSNVIHCRVSVPQAAFPRAGIVPVTVEVENKSSTEVYDVVSTVELEFHYGATWARFKPSRKDTLMGLEVHGGPVSPGMSPILRLDTPLQYERVYDVLMPAGPVQCKVIELSYRVHVEVKLKGMHRNLHVYLPIEIGKTDQGKIYPQLSK